MRQYDSLTIDVERLASYFNNRSSQVIYLFLHHNADYRAGTFNFKVTPDVSSWY